MKKIMALVLTLSVLACVPISASASDYQILDSENSATTVIEYYEPSDYNVSIPYFIAFDANYIFTSSLINIVPEFEYVQVVVSNLDFDNELTFTHNTIEEEYFKAHPVIEKTSDDVYVPAEIQPMCVAIFDTTTVSNVSCHWERTEDRGIYAAGAYSAVAEFRVSLEHKNQ